MDVVAVILAAGASRRLGRPKQLEPWRGEPLVRAIAREARASSCAAVAVVLGAREREVRAALEGLDVAARVNEAWDEGIASSLRCGVAWADAMDARAAIVIACDQPWLTSGHLDRLAAEHRAGAAIAASRYAGTLGIPALFDRATFAELRALRGDSGAKRVIASARGVVGVDWPEGALDVDTPEDAARVARSAP